MAKTVVALYDRLEDARDAVRELVDAGFPRDNISMVASDRKGEMASYVDRGDEEDIAGGTAAGAGIGAVLGGLGGLLVGLGALAIPGIGPVIAAGPLVSALAGAGIGAAAGGLIGALVDLGIPEDRAQTYAEGLQRGGTLVTVQATDDRANQAAEILNRHNPIDLDRRSQEWQGQGAMQEGTGVRDTGYRDETMRREDTPTHEEATFDVIEEDLRVGKREEETGGVRARTHVTEEPVEQDVTLRKEEIDVERRKVDRPLSDREADEAFQERSFEVTARSEEPVVEKRARVVEEVEIDKDVEHRTETIRDTVRRQDVDIERIGGEHMNEFDSTFQNHFQTTYSHTGRSYQDFQPAYYYGYQMGSQPRLRDMRWEDVREELVHDWQNRYQGSDWREHEDAVYQGWMAARRQR